MLSKSKFSEIIGNNVKKQRMQKELSQEELASQCGFYRTYINLIETAKRVPSSYALYKIAKTLKIEIDDLYPTTV